MTLHSRCDNRRSTAGTPSAAVRPGEPHGCARCEEEPFFFELRGTRMFGMMHVPRRKDEAPSRSPQGVLICSPFAEENAVSHHVMTETARVLCRAGFFVLRFDYRGSGDSEGEFDQATLTTRLEDIRRAVDVLCERAGTERAHLLGLRLGGTLAALAAADDPRVDRLALWEPIVNPRTYINQFLRLQVLAEARLMGRRIQRADLIERLKTGQTIEVSGYPISSACYREFCECDVPARVAAFQGPVLIVAVGRQQRERRDLASLQGAFSRSAAQVQMMQVRETAFWNDPDNPPREFATWLNRDVLHRQTLAWLEGRKP